MPIHTETRQQNVIRLTTMIVVFGVSLTFAPSAWANTRFGFGTIVKVDAKGDSKTNPGKAPGFCVLFEFYNLSPAVWSTQWYLFNANSRHGEGPRVYFLDGKPSNPQEALKVGRGITMTEDEQVVFVSSRPGPHTIAVFGKADSALYRVELAGAFQTIGGKVDKDTVGESKPLKSSLQLFFDCDGGAIRGLTVVLSSLSTPCDCSPGETSLKCADGVISGTLAPAFHVPKESGYRLKDGDRIMCSYSVTLQSDEKGVVTGTFDGTCGEAKVQGRIAGQRLARSEMSDTPRIWLQMGHTYLVLDLDNGKVKPGGLVLYSKGDQIGSVTEQNVSVNGTSIQGTLKGTADRRPIEVTLDGAILANRLIFGAYSMKTDKGEELKDRFRGGLTSQDGPQIRRWTDDQKKLARELQARVNGGK